MEIRVNRKDFVKALSVGGAMCGRSRVLPILDYVKIFVDGGKMRIVSSDSENTIKKDLILSSEHLGQVSFCVNFKDLYSYIRLCSGEEVTLLPDGNNKTLRVLHGAGEFCISCGDVDSFPKVKKDEYPFHVDISSDILKEWVYKCNMVKSTDMFRPALTGMYLYCKDGMIGCCASDGTQLFTDEIEYAGCSDFDAIVNVGALKEVSQIGSGEMVGIDVCPQSILVKCEAFSLYSRNIEGRYPNFRVVIPQQRGVETDIEKSSLVEALNRCELSAQNGIVKMLISPDKITLVSEDIDYNRKATENVACSSTGEMAIGFTIKKLLTLLQMIGTDKVHIVTNGSGTASTFHDFGDNNNKINLLMPCLID